MIFAQYIMICMYLGNAITSEYLQGLEDELPPDDKESLILMIEEATRLCQNINLCRSNISETNVALTEEIQNYLQCCQDCSCEGDCGKRGDCCFPTDEDKRVENIRRKYQNCIVPTTKEVLQNEEYKHTFYYMTTVCPEKQVVPGFENRESCGNIRVAPWGSLYPVYSFSTGRIYKNSACAVCHGVHDGILSMAFMDCKIFTDSTKKRRISVADDFNWLDRNSFSNYCHIRFRFKHSVQSEQCIVNIIDTCNSTYIKIPKWSKMTAVQIIKACHSGFVAPYQNRYWYSNVFCYLCQGVQYSNLKKCYTTNSENRESGSLYTCLLDSDVITTNMQVRTSLDRRPSIACVKPDIKNPEDACVSIQCPSGQIYNKQLQCVHPALVWQVPYYHVALRLKLVSIKLKTSTLMAVIRENRDINTWLLSPWSPQWTVNSLYYETGNDVNTSYVESFLVIIKTDPVTKHEAILRDINRRIKKFWTLNISANSIALSAEFLEYTIGVVIKSSRWLYAPIWYLTELRNQQTNHTVPFIEHSIQPIFRSNFPTPLGKITKMYFCKQISLGTVSSDNELFADEYLLFYNDRFYFDCEFEIVGRKDGAIEIRVCLSDSPYMQVKIANSAPEATVIASALPLMLLCVRLAVRYTGLQ